MSVEVSPIYLLDAAGAAVEAELRDAIEDAQIADWQLLWQPELTRFLKALHASGVPPQRWPQGWHWDWRRKVAGVQGLLAYRGFSVMAAGETQGLAQVSLNRSAREAGQAGKPIVYIDYLEAAPWNRSDLCTERRFAGVGTALVTAAVALSEEEGFKGRMGLHSLPQADAFYRERCGMHDLGPDASYPGGLRYFEMTPDQASRLLG